MDPGGIVRALIATAIGLALGSVLPADLLAKRRGVDIRAKGDGNPGTVNAVRVLGWMPGLVTGLYDVSAGVVAVLVAGMLGVPTGFAYMAGIAVVVGHRFPVFSGFTGGGQGMGACAGLLVYGIVVAVSRGWLTAADLALLVAVLALAFVLSRSDKVAAVAMLPVLVGRLVLAGAEWQFAAFMSAVAGYMWIVQAQAVRRSLTSRTAKPMHGQTRG